MRFNPDTKRISKTSMPLIKNKRICTVRKLVHEGSLSASAISYYLHFMGAFAEWLSTCRCFIRMCSISEFIRGFVHEDDNIKTLGKSLARSSCTKCIYSLSETINLGRNSARHFFSQMSYNLFPQINSTLCSKASDSGQLYWVVIKLDSHPSTSICISFFTLFLIQG